MGVGVGQKTKKELRGPGIEPGSTAWKAAMLTITPAALSLHILGLCVSIFKELGEESTIPEYSL